MKFESVAVSFIDLSVKIKIDLLIPPILTSLKDINEYLHLILSASILGRAIRLSGLSDDWYSVDVLLMKEQSFK